MKKAIINNQALQSHALFFDPVNKDLIRYADPQGRPMGKYIDKHPGVVVHENGDATFYYYAPNAKSVEVAGIGGTMGTTRHAMTKGEEGYWSVTVSGIGAGFHYHDYFVDGNRATSDLAPYGYGCFRLINFFEMPDDDSEFYLLQNVPHGTVRMDYFYCSLTGRMRNCFVYTPPGYETAYDKRYPVLYLIHGGGENETGWVWQGKINYIMDNLLASGECSEMIIVMPYSCAFPEDGSGDNALSCADLLITQDLIPFIDSKYRTIADKKGRAMAGLSMGGFHTQSTVFRYPQLFSAMGMFSSQLIPESDDGVFQTMLSDAEAFNKQIDLLFVTAGEQEPVCEVNKKTLESLIAKGFNGEFYSTPGYHEWQVWRYSAREFIKRLFK